MIKGKLKNSWKLTDILLFFISLPIAAYFITGLYPYIEQAEKNYHLGLIFLLTGTILGITISFNQFQKEEVRFLYIQTYNVKILSFYSIYKMLLPLLGVSCVFLISLMLYHHSFVLLWQLYLELTMGYFLGGALVLLPKLQKKVKTVNITSSLIVILSNCLGDFLLLKILICFLFILCYIWFAEKSWEGYPWRSSIDKQSKQKGYFSKVPVIKKELTLMFRLQRCVPLLIFFICGQFCYLFLYHLKMDAFIFVPLVFVLLMHDTWTLNLIGLEESAINLYIYSGLPLKKLIVTKWMLGFFIVTFIAAGNYLIWCLYYQFHITAIAANLLLIILFSFLTSSLNILIGIYFADFAKASYYRITFKGIVAAVFFVLLLIISYFNSFSLLIIETVLATFLLLSLLKSEEKLRGFFHGK